MSSGHDAETQKTYFQRSNKTWLDRLEELICEDKDDPIMRGFYFALGIPALVALPMGLLMESGITKSKFDILIILLLCTYWASLCLLFAGYNTKKEMNQLLDKLLKAERRIKYFDDLHIKLKTKAEVDEVDDEPLLTDEEQEQRD